MKIDIAKRLRPFSHEYGESFLVPRTSIVATVFPVRLELGGQWIEFGWQGPIKGFTAQLDLEREELRVFGEALAGYFSYVVKREKDSIVLIIEKVPLSTACRSSFSSEVILERKQRIEWMRVGSAQEDALPRLSLGSHKAQEFSKMKQRNDPCELFPLWLRLAQICPTSNEPRGKRGHYALLDACYRLVEEEKKLEIVEQLLAFFRSAFSGVFVPRLIDTEYQGIVERVEEVGVSPLPLLKESAEIIRSLFYEEKAEGEVQILPLLPPEFHCGRCIDIVLSSGVVLSFEWTKKKLRRLILLAPARLDRAVEMALRLPRAIRCARLTSSCKGAQNVCVEERVLACALEPGEKMQLDRFHTQ